MGFDNVLFRKETDVSEGLCCLHFHGPSATLKMEEVRSCEMSTNLYQTTWYHYLENSILHYTSLLSLYVSFIPRAVGHNKFCEKFPKCIFCVQCKLMYYFFITRTEDMLTPLNTRFLGPCEYQLQFRTSRRN